MINGEERERRSSTRQKKKIGDRRCSKFGVRGGFKLMLGNIYKCVLSDPTIQEIYDAIFLKFEHNWFRNISFDLLTPR